MEARPRNKEETGVEEMSIELIPENMLESDFLRKIQNEN